MLTENNNWYLIEAVNELDSPALVIYPERVTHNIQTAITMTGDENRLRPHIKTNKSPDVIQLLKLAGITKFKCATIAEAELLGLSEAKDVLLAYQPVGPKLKRFVSVIKKYPLSRYACLIDNIDAAREAAKIFAAEGLVVPVYIDVNVGQNRTGIEAGTATVELYIASAALKGIIPIGLHVYDGHLNDSDFTIRKQKCDACFATVTQMQDEIREKGLAEPVIIAGGSPSFSIHSKRENIECSPGTFIYWDKCYSDLCPEQNFLTAALIITRVISLPTKTTLCIDLGHKSVAAENEINRRVYFINAPELKATKQSEEHLIVEAGENHPYKIGDVLYALPQHICPTVALYERAYTVSDHKITGEWTNTARDRKINI